MKINQSESFDEEQERLRQENELKKINLKQNFGAIFPNDLNKEDLPLEIEGQFLDYVSNFENAYQDSNRIMVYDFIGRPVCRKSELIPDSEIGMELDRIMDIMGENQLSLDTICVVDDRVLYEFITEELFWEETDDMRVEGMTSNFIYEEFHPNHKHDITINSNCFFESFLNKESDYYTTYLSPEAEKNSWYRNFRNSFSSFKLLSFQMTSISYDQQTATTEFQANISGVIDGTSIIESFSGTGKIELVYLYDFWCVQRITLPPKL